MSELKRGKRYRDFSSRKEAKKFVAKLKKKGYHPRLSTVYYSGPDRRSY